MDTSTNKHIMSKEDIKLKFITPAIERAGWDKMRQIKMEYTFTDGRVIVRGKMVARGSKKRTDYILFYSSKTARSSARKIHPTSSAGTMAISMNRSGITSPSASTTSSRSTFPKAGNGRDWEPILMLEMVLTIHPNTWKTAFHS